MVHSVKFFGLWWPAAALSAVVEPMPAYSLLIAIDGTQVPLVTAALGAIGVLSARPLARAKEASLPLWQFLLVTAIMLIAVELWIVETKPGWLFAFVVALGLGFSGYALIELLGEEIKGLVRSGFQSIGDRLGGLLGRKTDEDSHDG